MGIRSIGWAKQLQTKTLKVMMAVVIASNGLTIAAPVFTQKATAATSNVTSLVFTTTEQSVQQGAVSSVITVETRNSSNAAESLDTSGDKLTVTSSSATGQFSSNGSSSWAASQQLNFNKNWSSRSFYYKDSTPGAYTITATLSDAPHSELSWAATQNITVTSTESAPADTTAPVISYATSPAANANGWNNNDVTVNWTVTDPESTITSETGCDATTLSTDTAGTTLTCSATSAGGTSEKSLTVKIDKTAPTATISAPEDDQVGTGTENFTGTANDENFDSYNLTVYDENDNPTVCAANGATAVVEDTLLTCDTTQLANGSYYTLLTATDKAGNVSTDRVDFSVENYPVTVQITSPADGATLSGTVTVSGSILGDEAASPVFIVLDSDGNTVAYSDQLTFEWDTTTVANGQYTIGLAALEPSESEDEPTIVGLDIITVTVDNSSDDTSTGTTDQNNNGTTATDDGTTTSTTKPATTVTTASATTGSSSDTSEDGQVLGDSTTDSNSSSDSSGHTKGASTTKQDTKQDAKNTAKKTCTKWFGICWYWWIPIIAAVIVIIYYVYKRADTEDKTASTK